MTAGDLRAACPRAAASGVARLSRVLGCLLLVLGCLPAHAQDGRTAAAAVAISAPAGDAAAESGPIPLVDIAERADADEGFARATRLRAQHTDVVSELQPGLDEIRASVLLKQTASRNTNLRTMPIARLESLSRYWGFDARQFKRWKAEYKSASEPLTVGADQISRRILAWEATRAAMPPGSVPEALSLRIDAVLRELNEARQALSAPLDAQIALGRRANRLDADIVSGQALVARAIAYIDKRLLRRDAPPLWRARGGATASPREAVNQAIAMETAFLRQYAVANFPNQRILQAIQLLLLPLLLWLAWRVRTRPGPVDEQRMLPLRRPIASWILLAMIGALVFEPDAPMLQVQVAIAMTLVPVMRLLPGDVRKRLGWWPYVAILLYLLLRLAMLPLVATDLYRMSLLVLALLGIVATLVLSWRLRRRMREAGDAPLQRVVLAAGGAVVAALTVSIVANAAGNVSLAEMLLNGVVESGYMALLAHAAYSVFSALLGELFSSRLAAPLARAEVGGTSLLALLLRLLAIATLVGWLVFAMQEFRVSRPVFEALRGVFTHQVSYGELSLSLGDIAVFVVAVFLAFWIASLVKVLLHEEVLPRMTLADGVGHSVTALTYYGVLILGLLGALSAAGFKLSQLSLLLGALGVGIGLGLQDVVKNFVSGLILMFERPLKPGDVVDVAGTTGRVHEIGMRATTLRTFDGADVVVPNGALLSEKLTNWTLHDRGKRMDVDIGVAYGTDAALAIRVLEQATRDTPKVAAEPAPVVLFLGLGESALNFGVRAWTAEFDESPNVRSALVTRLYAALDAAGIQIPFPQREVTLRAVAPGALDVLSPRAAARAGGEASGEAGT